MLALVSDSTQLFTSPMIALKLALPVAGLVLAIAAAFAAVAYWRNSAGTLGARLCYSSAVLTALAFARSLDVWNPLGWRA